MKESINMLYAFESQTILWVEANSEEEAYGRIAECAREQSADFDWDRLAERDVDNDEDSDEDED